jgi:hypothetical protein
MLAIACFLFLFDPALLEPRHESRTMEELFRCRESAWPKDPQGLIDHLNSLLPPSEFWEGEKNDPLAFGAVVNGEDYCCDNGENPHWVERHKAILTSLGVSIRWNQEQHKYERVP